MGKKGLIFYSEEALGHLDRIAAFLIERASVNIAEEITDDLLDRMDILAEMPYLGHQHPDPV
ncbi:MAG: type II toxin-antitoxin system RelE/ParE family toxin, partial [Clostridiales Family XIII bacterium]|nr:type II toxin-antitoxin system RelE/ParE family toxin [Clostridiales Family XIII bacterium]